MENSTNGASKRRKRGGGAATRREARLNAPVVFPKATIRNIPTYDFLASERMEAIDDHAMGILETIGFEFRDDASAELS